MERTNRRKKKRTVGFEFMRELQMDMEGNRNCNM
jgi:hypothetical protein